MGSIRIRSPVIKCGYINSICSHQADAVNDDSCRPGRRCDRRRIGTGGSPSIGEHNHYLAVGGWPGQKSRRFFKGISMVGASACSQAVYRRLKIGNRCNQLRIFHRLICKAYYRNPASASDISILTAVSGLVDNIDKCICSQLQIFNSSSRHASRAVQHQDNIYRIAGNIRCSRQRKNNLEKTVTGHRPLAQGSLLHSPPVNFFNLLFPKSLRMIGNTGS